MQVTNLSKKNTQIEGRAGRQTYTLARSLIRRGVVKYTQLLYDRRRVR